MRWTIPEDPANGTRRVRTRFLWFPKNIQGEIRWLERASWGEFWLDCEWIVDRWVECPNFGKREGAA